MTDAGDFAANFAVCMGCENQRQGTPVNVVLCSVGGRMVTDHAAAGDCPEGRFKNDPASRHRRRPLMATDEEMRELFARDERLGGCGCAP